MKKTQEKKNKMTRINQMLTFFLVPVVALILGIHSPSCLAEPIEFDEAEIFFEFNSTDLDLGIHIFFDAEGWEWVSVNEPGDGEIFHVDNGEGLNDIGSTEVFTESAEPEICDENCSIQDIVAAIVAFQANFPDGEYTFEGETVEEDDLEGEAELTHDLLEPVEFTKVNLPVIEWDEPEFKYGTNVSLEVVGYELVVELVILDSNDEERVFTETTMYPAGAGKHIVGNQFMKVIKNPPGEIVELKVEIIADEPSGNRTITEEIVFEEED